ncbi:hypothetical protein HN604_03225 [archaeon]|jgi:hypothetical protein|nr:hypothetical protein [archaeon]MBT6182499.1 hypothetical protein [archaeon]MBT6606191.1 hypothetical protein [archaeon]MBT7251640.1 hypothetical protein [archaeon]MBT7661070.1 hypothetical protein [archaeon]
MATGKNKAKRLDRNRSWRVQRRKKKIRLLATGTKRTRAKRPKDKTATKETATKPAATKKAVKKVAKKEE